MEFQIGQKVLVKMPSKLSSYPKQGVIEAKAEGSKYVIRLNTGGLFGWTDANNLTLLADN